MKFVNGKSNRKCTRRDLWDGDICDYAAIWWVLGRSLRTAFVTRRLQYSHVKADIIFSSNSRYCLSLKTKF